MDDCFNSINSYINDGYKDHLFSSEDTLILMNLVRNCDSLTRKIDPITDTLDKESGYTVGTNKLISLINQAEELNLSDFEKQISEIHRKKFPFQISPYNWVDTSKIEMFCIYRVIKKTRNKYYQKDMFEYSLRLIYPIIDIKSEKLFKILLKYLEEQKRKTDK